MISAEKVLACVAGAKRGGGGGREKSSSPFSLPPYPLPPTPFDACYAGYASVTKGLFESTEIF